MPGIAPHIEQGSGAQAVQRIDDKLLLCSELRLAVDAVGIRVVTGGATAQGRARTAQESGCAVEEVFEDERCLAGIACATDAIRTLRFVSRARQKRWNRDGAEEWRHEASIKGAEG